MLTALFRAFLDICLLRRGPQDLPASKALLVFSLAVYTLGSVVIARASLAWPAAGASAVLETLLMCGLTYALLYGFGLTTRWTQTATAIAGTNVVLVIFALPLLAWLVYARAHELDATIPAILFLLLVIWHLVILSHIFRQALSRGQVAGLLAALAYYWLILVTVDQLIPLAGAP